MVVKAINTVSENTRLSNQQQNNKKQNQHNKYNQSFTGGNPVVMLMDAIERGGFAASFIAQDGIGMVYPRIKEGLNRGRKTDENGKKHGPLNWEFARKEGIREILSGPSAFIIPAIMLHFITKHSGTANNVSIDMIKGLGENFEKYAVENRNTLSDVAKTKKEFYERIFNNVLKESTLLKDGDKVTQTLSDEEISKYAKNFTDRVIEIENAKSKGFFKKLLDIKVDGSAEDLTQHLTDDFMMLRKQHLSPSINEMVASLKVEGRQEPVSESFKKLLGSMKNYSNDAIESVNKQLAKDGTTDVAEFLKTHTSRRIGSRFTTLFSMFFAVVGFYTIIPKLYNLGLKGNPALKDQNEESVPASTTQKAEDKVDDKKAGGKNVSFQGAGIQKVMAKTGDTVMNTSWLKKLADKFDFDGPSMSVTAMLTLLFGFCLPPRYINGQDKYDKKEILVRDITSFVAILFAAKALSRACSVAFSKLSGLALNTKPADHAKSFLHKAKNYFTAGSGINVLSSEEIISKYTNIDKYPGGINGFFEFIENSGGNIKKMLRLDKNVKANAEAIVGKPLKDATIDEIKTAFKNVSKDNKSLENIYSIFRNVKGNKYINYAKTMNSSFGFLSTLVLVPSFMIWLARFCDRMTKNDRAKEKSLQAQQNADKTATAQPEVKSAAQTANTTAGQTETKPQNVATAQAAPQVTTITNSIPKKPTMAGFLNK